MMRRLLISCALLCIAASAFAWFAPGPYPDSYVTITRISTSETRTLESLPGADGGWDYGDTTNAITENYGGAPFENGRPVQIEVYIAPAPANDEWESISLQYVTGTNSGTNASWNTIATITNDFADVESVRGCHFGLTWPAPEPTNYLVRLYAVTTNAAVNGFPTATHITAKGDGLSWDNHEVVGFALTGNTRPGVQPR